MDVRLPDGTVVRGVPDGTSKADLVQKLGRNGYDTSWYKEEESSYANRVLTEGLPAVANIAQDIALSIPAGIRGAGEALATGSMERGAEGFESSMEQLRGVLPRFTGVEGTEQAFQEGFQKHIAEPVGQLAEQAASGTMFNLADDSRLGVRPQPGAQTIGEAAANFAPLPGARFARRFPYVGSDWKTAKLRAEAEQAAKQATELDAARQKQFQEQAIQRDWISEQREIDSGPKRPGLDYGVERGPQRDFWEQERPVDRGLEPSGRPAETPSLEYGKPESLIPVERGLTDRSALDLEKDTPYIRQDGIPFEKVDDGVSRILEQKKQAEQEALFRQRELETRSGLSKQTEIELAYEQLRPEIPGRTFLEKLEQDLTRSESPKRVGPFSGEVKLGVGIDAVEWVKRYGPSIADWAKKQHIPDLVYQGIPKGVSPDKPSYWFTTSLPEAVMWASRNGDGGRIAVASAAEIKGHRTKSERLDFPDSEHIYSGDTKSRPILREFPLVGEPTGGPGKKQGGAWTPLAKKGPSYQDFLKELKHAKLDHIPDTVKKQMWEGRQKGKTPEPISNPNQPSEKTIRDIPGLDKETRELYYDQRDIKVLGEDLRKLKGGDTRGGSIVVPEAYRAAKHTMTRWMNSKINETMDKTAKWAEDLQIGTKFKSHRRVVDPDSPRGLWHGLSNDQKVTLNKLGNALTDKNLPFTRDNIQQVLGRDLLPMEERAYKAMENISRRVLDDVINPARAAHDLPKLEPRNSYWSPATWAGDYIYFLKDAKIGVLVDVIGADFRPDSFLGRAFNRELHRRLKAHGVTFDPTSVRRKATSEEFSLAGLEVLMERRSKASDPKTKAVRDTAEAIMAEFNMRRARSSEREGRPGYLGSEGNLKGVKAFERVMDRYIQQAANNKANLELGRLYRDFVGEEATSLYPKAREASLAHLERSMGGQARAMKALDQAVADLLDRAGLSPSWWDRGINKINGISTRMLMGFWLPIQLGIQVLQPGFAIPKMIQLYGRSLGVHPAIGQFAAPVLVLKPLVKTLIDILTRDNAYLRELSEEGALSPSMKHEYTGFGETVFGERLIHRVGKTIIGDFVQQLAERNVVRSPAARMFYNTLNDLGVKGEASTRITKGLTEDYMVAWDRHKKAGWISSGGGIGRLMGALQSFTTTYLGQFLEYGRNAATKGEVMPLISFLGIAYALGGALGMLGVKEADWAINQINEKMETSFKTASEFILENAKSDFWRYGVVSAMTESNVSSTFGAPSATFIGAPGVQLMGGIIKLIGVLWKHATGDITEKPTNPETREAIKGVFPRVGHGALEEKFQEGDSFLDAKGNKVLKRDAFDKAMRHLGTYSLKEAEIKRMKYITQQKEAQLHLRRTKFVERLTNEILSKGSVAPVFVERAKELGYTDSSMIRQGVMLHLKNKYLDPQQRAIGRGTSQEQARAYQLYQRLQSEEERTRAANR